MKICILIPCYRHGKALGAVLERLRAFSLPVIVIDDGCTGEDREALLKAVAAFTGSVTLCTHENNQGKGAALITGFRKALSLGFTHALQVDADGQHDLSVLPAMLQLSAEHPEALISGRPLYDDSVPKSRFAGRYVTHVWVWVETLSLSLKDSMCGLRIYPLAPSLDCALKCGRGMDFDTECMVRLYWAGHRAYFVPVKVTYPTDGVSNFRVFKDNVKISLMHTRLVTEGLVRLVTWPVRRLLKLCTAEGKPAAVQGADGAESAGHWAETSERHGLYGMKFMLLIYRISGRRAFSLLLYPVIAVFYVTAKEARVRSREFLEAVKAERARRGMAAEPLSVYRHFYNFGQTLLDKVAAWQGSLCLEHEVQFAAGAEAVLNADPGMGKVLFTSHLGDIELCRALITLNGGREVTALVFHENAARFKAVMEEFAPQSKVNLIALKELSPALLVTLQERIAKGHFVAIASDRLAVPSKSSATERYVTLPFMGKEAPFAMGPAILASLLQCPVITLFALREGKVVRLYAHEIAKRIRLERRDRGSAVSEALRPFVNLLEEYALTHPYDWFNFYAFWSLPKAPAGRTHGPHRRGPVK